MVTRFFCLAISITARAVEEVGKSAIMSTLPRSRPFAGEIGGDIGLVLVISSDQFHRRAGHLAAHLVDGDLRRDGVSTAGESRNRCPTDRS